MHAGHRINVVERYSVISQVLHWTTALLVVAAYITSVGGSETRVYSSANDFSRGLHELLGICVFALTLVRVCWRAIVPPPQSRDVMPLWMELGARLGHWALYALLVLVPITAILGAWLEGHPLTVLVLGNVQPRLPQSHELGLLFANIHGWLGTSLISLAGFHAVAALYHHFWRRDAVLLSMLPGRSEAQRKAQFKKFHRASDAVQDRKRPRLGVRAIS
jgi:cytochrome b561